MSNKTYQKRFNTTVEHLIKIKYLLDLKEIKVSKDTYRFLRNYQAYMEMNKYVSPVYYPMFSGDEIYIVGIKVSYE